MELTYDEYYQGVLNWANTEPLYAVIKYELYKLNIHSHLGAIFQGPDQKILEKVSKYANS